MSMEFSAFSVPDAHIRFLADHPGSVHDYIEGKVPAPAIVPSVPEWWPTEELESLGSWGINHGNVDLYHWILNGSPELAEGAGSIFQTWYAPEHHSAEKLDAHNERFAFDSTKLDALATLAEAVTVASVLKAFVDWCKSRGKPSDNLDEYACQPFVDEFSNFAQGLREAIVRGHGIVW